MGVKELYIQYLKEGKPPKEAAKLAQEQTGLSAVTGRPMNRQLPGHPSRAGRKEGKYGKIGQYTG